MNSANREVIVLCPTRNEEANLRRLIPAWLLFADRIVIADQQSTDGTSELCRNFEQVHIVKNDDTEFSETRRNQLLVETARKLNDHALFLYLDADEILSADIRSSPEWQRFQQQLPGTVGVFPWVQLWRSPARYIARGTMAPMPYALAFIDDGRPIEGRKVMHEQRGVGVTAPERVFHFGEIVCLHLAWRNYERASRKSAWYKMWWTLNGSKSHYVTNRNHNWHRKIEESQLDSLPEKWLEGYSTAGLDITSTETENLYWWDIDILNWFQANGTEKFFWVDVWDETDWEVKRQLAAAKGIEGIPDQEIKGPARAIRVYHRLLARRLRDTAREIGIRMVRGLARVLFP